MSIGAVVHSLFPGSTPRRCSGFSLVEVCLTMGIVGFLGATGASIMVLPSPGLSVVKDDLEGAMYQAFTQARAQGRDVHVALGAQAASSDVLPVNLPRNVKWGKLATVPLPPGMDEPIVAASTGEAHHRITVTPRHTVTATCWFLNDGKDVFCFRLSGRGQMHLLRWRAAKHKWGRA